MSNRRSRLANLLRYLLQVCRYAERNPLRAGLVRRAEAWRWSSLWQRENNGPAILSHWPTPRPTDWVKLVNAVQPEAELAALRRCVQRGQPYGEESWAKRVAKRLALESTLRQRGRPRKASAAGAGGQEKGS